MPIPLYIDAAEPEVQAALLPQAQSICQQFAFEFSPQAVECGFQLGLNQQGLKLYWRDEPKINPLMVDFVAGSNAHRRQFGGGRGQTIAKAVGLKQGANPNVIDGTAGLGKDAFVLASLGCKVTLVERHPVVKALLQDGLQRAYADDSIGEWMRERMILSSHSHICELEQTNTEVDVVYLDPMYPHEQKAGKKSALVKKDMRLFQHLVGSDQDANQLLAPALQLAKKRVVVKRPDYAECLDDSKSTYSLEMKKNRFDIYVTI